MHTANWQSTHPATSGAARRGVAGIALGIAFALALVIALATVVAIVPSITTPAPAPDPAVGLQQLRSGEQTLGSGAALDQFRNGERTLGVSRTQIEAARLKAMQDYWVGQQATQGTVRTGGPRAVPQ